MLGIGTAIPQMSRASVPSDGASDNPPSLVDNVLGCGVSGGVLGGLAGTAAGMAALWAGGGEAIYAALVCMGVGIAFGAAMGISIGVSDYHAKLDAIEQQRIGTSPDELAQRVLLYTDQDGDGAVNIDTESLRIRLQTRNVVRDGYTTRQVVSLQDDYTRPYREMDTNGDGDVTKSEIAAAYRRFDTNSTGGIDSEEEAAYKRWTDGLRDTKTLEARRR